MRHLTACLKLICLWLLVALPAQAAEMVLEEIVVTAQKRSQSIQDVPISVTAFEGSTLEDYGAVNLTDLNGIAPNVVLQPLGLVPNIGQIAIRGISFADPDPNADPKTGLIVDGAVLARNSGVLLDAFDIARVEILRGPQGTLFGRNNLSGTINMVTERPTEEFGGKVKATYGNYGQQILRAAVNSGRFADDALSARLSVAARSFDGYQENAFNGHDLGDTENYGSRFGLAWDAGNGWDATLLANYEVEHFNGPASSNQVVDPEGDGLDGDVYEVQQDLDGFSDFETWGVTIEANKEIDVGTFTIVGNYREQEYTTFGDFDGRVGLTPPPPVNFHIGRDMSQDQHSLEIRFADSHSELFDYVVGVFYFEETYEQDNLRSTTSSIQDSALLSVNGQTSESYAVFGQTDVNITEKLALVLGARMTYDDKEFKIDTSFGGTPIAIRSNDDWNETTWKVGLNYFVNEDLMLYGSVATGYKSGGYNSRATVPQNVGPYDPETLDNYEIGMKADFADKRIRVNTSAFFGDYSDLQGSVRRPGANPAGTESITQNLGDAEIWGIEAETVFLVGEGFTITANLAYLDAEWKDYMADLTNSGVVTDNSYLELPNAPEWTGYLGLDYEQPIGAGAISWHADARYSDEYNTSGTSNAEVFSRDNVTLINAHIGYSPDDGQYSVSVYGRNLSDEEVISGTVSVLFPLWYFQPPREYGAEFQWNF